VRCGVGRGCGWEPTMLWLWQWHKPAATAPTGPLAWEPQPVNEALKKKKKKSKQNMKQNNETNVQSSTICDSAHDPPMTEALHGMQIFTRWARLKQWCSDAHVQQDHLEGVFGYWLLGSTCRSPGTTPNTAHVSSP